MQKNIFISYETKKVKSIQAKHLKEKDVNQAHIQDNTIDLIYFREVHMQAQVRFEVFVHHENVNLSYM